MQSKEDFIEPGEFEKSKLRPIVEEIARLAGKGPDILGAEIRAFAFDAKLDFFSALESSVHPHVKPMGSGVAFRAAFLAYLLLTYVGNSVATYIDENPRLKAVHRRKLLSDYIVAKKVFKRDGSDSDYDDLPPEFKAQFHINTAGKFVDRQVKHFLLKETEKDPLLKRLGEAIGASEDPREYGYPLETHPELIGFVYGQYHYVAIMMKHLGKLRGMSDLDIGVQAMQIKNQYMQSLAQPRAPNRLAIFHEETPVIN